MSGRNEAETRAELIDPALKDAGWGEFDGSRVRREFTITLGRIQTGGRRSSSDIADYVLEFQGHQLFFRRILFGLMSFVLNVLLFLVL